MTPEEVRQVLDLDVKEVIEEMAMDIIDDSLTADEYMKLHRLAQGMNP